MELDKSALTNDQLRVSGALTYGGSLVVTNLGGTLWAGDTFHLFNAPTPSGGFTATNLPPLPNGFSWQWAPASGTLSILSTVALNPTNITAVANGNALQISWPADHTGWHLQSQTNDVAVGLGTNWFDVPGSSGTNLVVLPLDPAVGTSFYRLVFP
jgi:hypothetical protein